MFDAGYKAGSSLTHIHLIMKTAQPLPSTDTPIAPHFVPTLVINANDD